MMTSTTKMIAAATVVCGVAIFINLGLIISLFIEIGEFHDDAHTDMQEFNAVADQTWTTILIATPAAAAREKRATKRSGRSGCGCSAQPNSCPRGPMGPRGRPGGKGHDGPNGVPGPNAHGVSGLVLMATGKKSCIKCAPGPQGLQGKDGQSGKRGADGAPGKQGVAGRNGLSGPRGPLGDAGVRGGDGELGPRGYPGRGGVKGQGAPGGAGRIGGKGNFGKQGRRGSIGAPGTPGPMGPNGEAGSNGKNGLDGQSGAVGPIGAPGKNGEYCLCPKKDKAVQADKVVKNDRGYEVPQDVLEVQRLVESSAFKMEPTAAPSSSESAEVAAPIEEVTEAASTTTTRTAVAYDQAVEVTTQATIGGASSPSSTAPPGFAPPRAKETKSSSSGSVEHGYDAAPVVPATVNDQAVVQVTPIQHRAMGGGHTTPIATTTTTTTTTTTRKAAPLVKFARHAGGWSRKVHTPPHPKPAPKTHDADLHVTRKSAGGARAL